MLTAVLRSGDQPVLNRSQFQRIMRAHHAHREYTKYAESLDDSDDDEGPQNDDAWLYEDLIVLGKLYSRLKDREQLIALIFEVSVFILDGYTTRNQARFCVFQGHDGGSTQRHHHYLLRPVGTGLSCRQHIRFPRRHAELH